MRQTEPTVPALISSTNALKDLAGKTRTGPFGSDGLTYWLLPSEAGAAERWREVDSTLHLLTTGAQLSVPDPEPEVPRPHPSRWIFWPKVTGTLTPPDVLATAIRQQLVGKVK
jgi:hypothetical protein